MKERIEDLLNQAIETLVLEKKLPESCLQIAPIVTRTKDKKFGDYNSNIALQLSKILK